VVKTSLEDPRRTGAWPNAVLYRRARTTGSPEHVAPLSLHVVFRGREVYETRSARHALVPGRYLVLNAGQQVRTDVAGGEPVESVSVMFGHAFAQDVLTSLATPLDRLLDDPERRGPAGVLFFERTYPLEPSLERLLLAFRSEDSSGEEAYPLLLDHLLGAHRGLRCEVDRLPAVRAATRAEIYRRLVRARDFVEASWAESLTLSAIARVAGIAPHRFLRLFREAFGLTPHRYLTERRLQEARGMLEAGRTRVTDACLAVGFTSLGSFSAAYRRRFGHSPEKAISEKPEPLRRP
jgi:AraC family transcriptional regulator